MSDLLCEQLNALSAEAAVAEFIACCGANWWAAEMANGRPYTSTEHLHAAADEVFDRMPEQAWLEAFASHPRIGDLQSLKMKFAGNQQWSSTEQQGVSVADERVLSELQQKNQTYFDRFGYTFIVCATGKSAAEMLAILEGRLGNDPETELRCAADEQRKITHLRIDKLASTAGENPKGNS